MYCFVVNIKFGFRRRLLQYVSEVCNIKPLGCVSNE
jgi:hypothetical protein